ncbi:MAG: CapA family protein [Candidatus Paceibacterota bacterium]
MEKSLIRNKVFYFLETCISLSVFISIFYLIVFTSYNLFAGPLAYFEKNVPINNEKMVATTINFDNDNFSENIKDKKEIKIAFVGDIMLDRGVEQKIRGAGNGDFDFVFQNIKEDLKGYDFLVGNLEGPVSDKGKDKYNLYSFRMEPEVLKTLEKVGFDVLSVANNHMGDWGIDAIVDTFDRFNETNIKFIGGGYSNEQTIKPVVLEKEGVKIGLLAFSQFGDGVFSVGKDNAGIYIISESNLKESIDLARNLSDIVVVSFHFGDEYQEKQNYYQEKYSQMAINFGADLVVGHHPHVVQPLEKYKNTYIAYSLGNFVFDQYFSKETMEGGLIEVDIRDKKISSIELRKIQINSEYQPSLIE